jgi:hypothetical protein
MNVKSILNIFQLIKNYQEIMDLYKLDNHIKTHTNRLIKEQNDFLNNNNNNDIKNIDNNNLQLNTYKKMIVYKSKIISKIELSMELIYNLFFREKGKKRNINIFFNLIFELIKAGAKIKELNSLRNLGIPFYVDEDIFYNEYLGIDKNKYIENIINNNNNDINNTILPINGNLFLPIKEKINNKSYKNKFYNDIINVEGENKNIFDIRYINKIHFVGEILYLIRPIIYLTLLSIFKNNKIVPLIINIIIDIIIYFSRIEFNRNNFRNFGLNFLTQKIHHLEMNFRTKNLFVYLFREPIFSFVVIPLMKQVFYILHIPNFISETVLDIMENFSRYSYIA